MNEHSTRSIMSCLYMRHRWANKKLSSDKDAVPVVLTVPNTIHLGQEPRNQLLRRSTYPHPR